MSRMVIALGGNALGNTPAEQIEKTKATAEAIVPLVAKGHSIVLCHGNGPQVGMIHNCFEQASKAGEAPYMPLTESTAMSQGYIGYHLQQALRGALRTAQLDTPVTTLVTQVVVDADDPAFDSPDKPIGGYLSKEEAQRLMQETGDTYMEDAGRGWRRAVASPKPEEIVEHAAISAPLAADELVVACGGGGVPVIKKGHMLEGIPAVVDKDFASARLAELIEADYLFILTAVERAAKFFGTDKQEEIEEMTVAEAREYEAAGHFAAGSMLPKVEAACQFVEAGGNRRAIIGSLEHAAAALAGESGTTILP